MLGFYTPFMDENIKKILVAGYFDTLHPGHVQFLEKAASYGDVSVVVGSDESSVVRKGKRPIFNQRERAYMVRSLKYVTKTFTSPSCATLNFEPYLEDADVFIINKDGDTPEKKKVCEKYNVKYLVLERTPKSGLRPYSSTDMREKINLIPQRLDITGFYDQKLLNSVCPGSVILANISPIKAEERSGLSSSTTNVIRKLFGPALPTHISPIDLAKAIFAVENPPDREYISGVVDQLGICLPGINKLNFDNEFFPSSIESIEDRSTLEWLSSHLFLLQTEPRPEGYVVFDGREQFTKEKVEKLALLSPKVWDSIKNKDIIKFGNLINQVHDAQKNMIPGYESPYAKPLVEEARKNHLGVKLMGAGGYGYMMIVSDKPVRDGIKIKITCP